MRGWNLKPYRKWNGRDGWYEIPPTVALAILEASGRNRPLKEFRAQKIAAEIQTGVWRPNGESIVFDEKGRLLDGQHRLRACVLANKPILVYCVFGVPAKYFPSLDQGAVRGGGDLAALMDFTHYNAVAALARLAMGYADGTLTDTGKGALSAEKLRFYMERNRERLEAACAFVSKHKSGIRPLTSKSHVAFVYYMNAQEHPSEAADFVEKLASGAGLHKGSALLIFRQRMTDMKGQKHKMRHADKVALIIKAWNGFLSGRPVGVLRWLSEVEAFPRFGGKSGNGKVSEEEPPREQARPRTRAVATA